MTFYEYFRRERRPLLTWTLIISAWTLFGVLIAVESFFRSRARGEPMSLASLVIWYLAWAGAWAIATPLILWLARRFPFNRAKWKSSLAIHLFASLAISWLASIAWNSAGQLLGYITPGTDVLFRRSIVTFVAFLHFDPYLYWIIIGLFYLIQQYQANRERELRASQLETQLAEARLQALEARLHPHFLFNALNTIAVLVRTERNAQAVRVVTGLGELLRHALDGVGSPFVPLKQEIEFIRRYLEIEQIRFGDRLQVEMDIESDVVDAQVPYLILQPLVENAIRHGIAYRAAAGRLRIAARREGERLRLTVEDDGPGLPQEGGASQRDGVGLSTTAARLEQLYGQEHQFSLENLPEGGVAADLALPFRLTPGELQRQA
ncbi:MAG: hypothetical protein GWN08_09600 [Gemmatimonadetes bacterium]|nr:hypothetical protein [Gemmatimonadota bacterium]